MQILYVEDDAFSREVMSLLVEHDLAAQGLALTLFSDSENFEARLLALDPPPGLIFLDIHLKPLNGFELLACIRQHARFDQTPVIALTASVMNEEMTRLRSVGFDGAIAKPIDQDLFPQWVNRILAGESIWQILSR